MKHIGFDPNGYLAFLDDNNNVQRMVPKLDDWAYFYIEYNGMKIYFRLVFDEECCYADEGCHYILEPYKLVLSDAEEEYAEFISLNELEEDGVKGYHTVTGIDLEYRHVEFLNYFGDEFNFEGTRYWKERDAKESEG